MKRVVTLLFGACFLFALISEAEAWSFGKKKQSPETPATQEVQPEKPVAPKPTKEDKAQAQAIQAKKVAAERKLNDLNNTEWQIELAPLAGKGKKEAETVYFKNNQVSFANFGKKGFPPTNFTLTVQEDGMVIWETMQTADKGGAIAFWRGEIDPTMQTMRGVVSHQIDAKTKIDFSFASLGKKNITASGK